MTIKEILDREKAEDAEQAERLDAKLFYTRKETRALMMANDPWLKLVERSQWPNKP